MLISGIACLKYKSVWWLFPLCYFFSPWLLAWCWPWFSCRLGEEIWVKRASLEISDSTPCEMNDWILNWVDRIESGEPNHDKSLTVILQDGRASCDQMAWILQRIAIKADYQVWTIDICPTVHRLVFVKHPIHGSWLLDPYERLRLNDQIPPTGTCLKVRDMKKFPPVPNRYPFAKRPFCYDLISVSNNGKMEAWNFLIGMYAWWFKLDLDILYLRWFTDLPIPKA